MAVQEVWENIISAAFVVPLPEPFPNDAKAAA